MSRKRIYLAGGCFWGMQAYFDELNGVVDTEVGYANGKVDNPTYEIVCRQDSGFAETLRIDYETDKLSLAFILDCYFKAIDPTSYHRQGEDVGSQYRSGIYYIEDEDKEVAELALKELKREYEKPLAVECERLKNFYPAELYHQKYLKKNPQGYCHIPKSKIERMKELNR